MLSPLLSCDSLQRGVLTKFLLVVDGANQVESRKFIADHCIRKDGDARYALKILSKEVVEDPGNFIQGSIDMAVETRMLSDIEHPNIIKMRACGEVSPFEVGYFLGKNPVTTWSRILR